MNPQGQTTARPPSIAELRTVTQPASVTERGAQETWAASLYMRRVSPYFTRLLLTTPLSPNAVTALMIPVGLAAGLVLTLPGVLAAVGVVLLVQLQVLLDCSDGEVARWRGSYSPRGIYLDHIVHYVTEAAIPAGLGVRAAAGWGSIDGWTSLGLLVAVLILILKSETHLAGIARLRAGRPVVLEEGTGSAGGRYRLRDGVRLLPSVRPFQAVEASLLALAAAIGDAASDSLLGTQVLLAVLGGAALVAVLGHGAAILRSDRLA
jgi:phosphatidylglycerophosphate synthase